MLSQKYNFFKDKRKYIDQRIMILEKPRKILKKIFNISIPTKIMTNKLLIKKLILITIAGNKVYKIKIYNKIVNNSIYSR